MVTQEELNQEQLMSMTYKQRQSWFREKHIAQGIAWGMSDTLEWVKAEEEGEEDSPEEIADDIRVAKERRGTEIPGDWLSEIDQQFPEDIAFFKRMNERFPDGYQWVRLLDPESEDGCRFFAQLKSDFPQAWDFFLADVE